MTFWLAVLLFPEGSVKVQVTRVVPTEVIGNNVAVVPVIVPEQSLAVGGVRVTDEAHAAFTAANVGAVGAVVSKTVTMKLH